MAYQRYDWKGRDYYIQKAQHLDFLTMFDQDVVVRYHDSFLFFTVWDSAVEPMAVIALKKQLTEKKIHWLQLPGRELSDEAIAEANLLQSLKGLSDNTFLT